MSMYKKIILIIALLGLVGCAGKEYDKTADWSAMKLYEAGRKDLASKRYDSAIDYYQKLEARFPYGVFAQQAGLEAAYALWKHSKGAEAVASCERFIRDHPKHRNVPYAYYLKGYIYLSENVGLFSFLGAPLSETDPSSLKNAFETFRQLVVRYPESKYTSDARARMRLIVNTLADHQANVAEYYLRRGFYVAAVGRAKEILQIYPETPAVERSLMVLVKSYEKMGLPKLRDDTKLVLSTNYPKNPLVSEVVPESRWKLW